MVPFLAQAQDQQEAGAAPPNAPVGTIDSTYKLGPGDRVRINVFNQPDLSGEYTLDSNGRFSMPLIGTVDAGGLTPVELEVLLIDRFKPDYLVNPRIFIQVGNYRPYYLMGEVASKGAFPYQPGLTYLEAIANAGGFTYRAKQDHVFVIRGEDPEQEEIKLSIDEEVQPGDIIRVAERLF
jgi:polysaccharide export outer membrane protein